LIKLIVIILNCNTLNFHQKKRRQAELIISGSAAVSQVADALASLSG
jgi:hypothetical protein